MIYNELNGEKVSALGFGTMRLPLREDKSIDQEQVDLMTDYAIEHGINYFDTAYPYHESMSEISIGKALARHPRESFMLATKYPGHQIAPTYDPAKTFEEQLKKCQVEYFDFYLMHNIYENSIKNYLDPRWKMVEYFVEQKKLGRIKHLGFSTHADIPCLTQFLDAFGEHMDFCQIQLNYLDWTLQSGKEKYELLTERHIPIIVMEPLRGGKLSNLSPEILSQLESMEPGATATSWALRYFRHLPNVKVVLSGMSNFEQMKQNVSTYEEEKDLTQAQVEKLYQIAESMKDSLPCTSCRYCTAGCPKKLDIPTLLKFYNDLHFDAAFTVRMRMEAFTEEQLPGSCIHCHKCESICPQKIKISDAMETLDKQIASMPTWAEICRKRNEAAARAMQK